MSQIKFVLIAIVLVTSGWENLQIEAATFERRPEQIQVEGLKIGDNVATVLPGYKAEQEGNKVVIRKAGASTAALEITCHCSSNFTSCGVKVKGKEISCAVPLAACAGEPCLMQVRKPLTPESPESIESPSK
jgi:hypothetical protein